MSERKAKTVLKVLLLFFVAVFSMLILSAKIPQSQFVNGTINSLDDSKATVMEFTGATLATSLAISALPDDFASPLANSLAEMSKYFVFILVVLFVERLIVVEGTKIALVILIPLACGLYILYTLFKKNIMEQLACKFMVLSLALVLVIPCSTFFTNAVASDYLTYVNETIEEANEGADKIHSIIETKNDNETMFERLSDVLKTAVDSMDDLFAYFNNMIKKCVNSIAILIVTTFVVPLLTIFFFKWLLSELFNISIPKSTIRVIKDKDLQE